MANSMKKDPAAESEAEAVVLARIPRIVTFAAVGTFVIVLTGAVYYARGFFLPILLAVLITMTLRPLVSYLSRRGVPAAVSAVLLVLLIGIAVIAVAAALAGPFTQMVADAPTVIAELRQRFQVLAGPIALLADAGRQVQELAAGPATEHAERVVIAQPGLLSWAADTVTGIGTTLGATLILAVFLLSSGDLFLLEAGAGRRQPQPGQAIAAHRPRHRERRLALPPDDHDHQYRIRLRDRHRDGLARLSPILCYGRRRPPSSTSFPISAPSSASLPPLRSA